MSHRPVVVFSMAEPGHFRRLLPMIAGLARRGTPVHVFTAAAFRPEVERAGGVFADLFAAHALEDADDASLPVPCRFVTFAGCFGGDVAERVRALGAALVVHDTFAVVGRVVAAHLGLPRVNVCAGHAVIPDRFLATLATDPRVRVAPSCLAAVETLRARFGLSDASPFSYVDGLSPDLNVYCEPPAFLDDEDRRAMEPIAFFGSLPENPGPTGEARAPGDPLRVYASFGTVVWRYYAADAVRALTVLAEALGGMPGVRAVIGLGGIDPGAAVRQSLVRPNVRVEPYVDQWALLRGTDVFVTHHGLNSTHEAIHLGVPMLSYPFFWDQPALAARCRDLGLALPLADRPRGALTPSRVTDALAQIEVRRETMRAAFARAQEWERRVMRGRGAVIDRILGLCASAPRLRAAASRRLVPPDRTP